VRIDKLIDGLLVNNQVTANYVAKEIGISKNTLGHWRTGNSIPRVTDLNKVLDYFGYELKVVKK
jgi:transcriptional regulator with XRE-family HTH domain